MACVTVSGVPCTSSKYQTRSMKRSLSSACSFDTSEDALQREFHEMFRLPLERRKHDKKSRKKTPKERRKLKNKAADIQPWRSPVLEIQGNPSPFAVFTNVRQCILVKHLQDSARHFYWITAPQSAALLHALDSDSENEGESAAESKDAVQTVPRIVGVGLCTVFELIRESRSVQPAFCLSVLRALLDVLQGQQPEGFRSEPPEVLDKMFDLLLDIATKAAAPVQYGQAHSSNSEVLSQLTSNACACLLSLVVATGDTSKMLSATAALLMSPRSLTAEEIPMPSILVAMQKSVQAVLLGKVQRPTWLSHGIPRTAHCGTFSLHLPKSSHFAKHMLQSQCTIACDGKFLYLFRQGILYKLGTGFGGTVKGELITSQQLDGTGWIGIVQDYLYIHHSLGRINEFLKVDKHTLQVEGVVTLEEDSGQSVYFSDGEFLGLITAMRDDGFVIRTFRPSALPMTCSVELNLKLARKCVEIFGSGVFNEEAEGCLLDLGCEEEPVIITSGKEFALVKTASGKILYTGNAQSLGIKQTGTAADKWAELPITKCPKMTECSVGHDGTHALLVSENGAVFFVGAARRGEDGDVGKGRRQPKPMKPKKMLKMEGHFVVASACNNGTSALVTRSGELFLFGKDSSHADRMTGLVTGLKDVAVSQVALGKAHVVALTTDGRIYTFGINHRGQCGREFSYSSSKDVHPMALVVTGSVNLLPGSGSRAGKAAHHNGVIVGEEEDEDLESEEQDIMCPPGKHSWKEAFCKVCTVCGECTGYGASCIASGRPERNPGTLCGCGKGDCGCLTCGCCRVCAAEDDYDAELAAWNRAAVPAVDGGAAVGGAGVGGVGSPLLDNKQAKVIIFDMRYGGRVGARLEDKLRRSIEEYRFHHRRKQGSHSLKAAKSSPGGSSLNPYQSVGSSLGDGADVQDGPLGGLQTEDAVSSDHEREALKVTLLPPAILVLPVSSPAVQVACGMHHTVVLLQNGQVFTFGNNQHGQLGHGDLVLRGSPTLVYALPTVTQVAAGSNHSVFLTVCGQVYTCGSYQKGQLGRGTWEESGSGRRRSISGEGHSLWHAVPGAMPGIGVKRGRRATWVGASGDHTFVKLDEFLTSASSLAHCSVVANRSCLGIISKDTEQASKFKCLMINRADGSCKGFNSADQIDLRNHAVCLDSIYSVLWSLNQKTLELSWHSIVWSEAVPLQTSPEGLLNQAVPLPLFLGPELSLPGVAGHPVGRCQAALNLLGALDVLTAAQEKDLSVREDIEQARQQSLARAYTRDDFSIVNRFESHGGGWGYSGHSVEAIRVMADTDILLGGVGLFGGRGEYTALIRVFDIGTDGGDQETDGEMLTETEEMPYECSARHKYPILFEEPVLLQANRWYVVWAHVSGPSSDCGSSGQSVITTEDQVVFYFKSSKKSNNGTDVNAGQIPQLLYRVIASDVQTSGQPADQSESVTILSHKFSKTVTLECFQSLLKLLNWGWKAFRAGMCELADSPSSSLGKALLLDLRKLLYICAASLHLLRIYINEVYPIGPLSKKVQPESSRMAECVADTRSLLSCILSGGSGLPEDAEGLLGQGALMQATLLEECEAAFMACYHTFYPSTTLKWRGLCELLVEPARCSSQDFGDRLLAAVLSSLCSPAAQLTCLLPPSLDRETRPCIEGPCSPESPSTGTQLPDVADSSTVYPLLVEVVARKTLKEGYHTDNCSFRDVLERLLSIVIAPVQSVLKHEAEKPSVKLVSSTCAFLSAVVAELSSQTIGCAVDVQRTSRQALHCTPSRFSRVCQNRTWNTGNGSPDAICFSVDRPGVLIAGACIYGGIGNEWQYEFELLDDSGVGGELPHMQRWKQISEAQGSFGPEDCYSDVAEVKFDRPIPIKENTKYALRLKNHGARTNNGDGGVAQVKGPDGTTFTFSDSSLSFNGTNHTRGQIPQILYYSTPHDTESQQAMRDLMELQARRNVLNICGTIVKASAQLLSEAASEQDDEVIYEVGSSHLMTQLLPLILAHLCPVASSDSQSAVEVLDLVQKLLKWVSTLNQRNAPTNLADALAPMDGGVGPVHYAVVESDHPYKPATVFVSKVKFAPSVRWMALEFDPRCGTTQVEDSLQLYIPSHNGLGHVLSTGRSDDVDEDASSPFWPVLQRFHKSEWPTTAVILPGNQLVFSLETASDCAKDNKTSSYGFRCQVAGYEGVSPGSAGGLLHLEKELSYLGGMCAASLLRRDLILPTVLPSDMEEDMEVAEPLARQVFSSHSALLSRGFALAHLPTIQQALEGSLSFSDHSNERPFLHDFVSCTPGTSGGRLARWLQPECCVDPKQCELICSQEELKCGWPSVITVFTRDQYAYLVHVPNMKVEVRAVPMNAYNQEHAPGSAGAGSNDQTGLLTFGGHPPPSLDVPYEVTVRDKMLYYAITTMRQYEDYSFEELRYVSPTKKRLIENMLVRANDDGTYTANWTPGSVGWYLLHAIIDGFEIGSSQCRLVEVKEPPQGLVIPSRSVSQKSSHQPNKMRKFQAKYSAGLRIRSHPSLQSKQIGVVQADGTVTFVDELHNDDGVWVRLSPETIKTYCQNGYSEAWCLQYNQHIGKTLLVPYEEPKAVRDEFFSDRSNVSPKKKELKEPKQRVPQVQHQHQQHQQQCQQQNQQQQQKQKQQQHQSLQHQQQQQQSPHPHDMVKHGPGMYQVASCGAAGHNVRSKPNLKAPSIGVLAMDSTIIAIEEVSNSEGVWLRLNQESLQRHNLSKEGEAWTLARTAAHVVPEVLYLRHESEVMQSGDSDDDSAASACGHRCSQAAASSSSTVRSRGYNFGMPVCTVTDRAASGCANAVQGLFTFGSGTSDPEGGSSGSASPFVFGSPASTPSTSTNALADSENTGPASERSEAPTSSGSITGGSSHLASRRLTSADSSPPPTRAVPPELRGVSVRDLVRAIGESRANGNGTTPPGTPPVTPPVRRRRSSASSKPAASSPVPIPGVTVPCSYSDTVLGVSEGAPSHSGSQAQIESARSATPSQGSLTESTSFPKHPGLSPRRASIQSESSVSSHLGSFFRELRDTSATGCIGCITQRTTDSPLSTPGTPKKESLSPTSSLKSFTQTGTQTSPEGGPTTSIKGHFSIGSNSSRDESPRVSPKMSRRERTSASGTRHVLRGKRERIHSEHTERPAATEPYRQGLSPSVAECLRAVFCAFLWHEGVVHDAMACASFLKFNPDLRKSITKRTVAAAPLTKEQKARFRHSVEVTSPSLLHLQQLETLQSNEPLNENIKLKRAFAPATTSDQVTQEGSSVQEDVATDLPRALRFLVLLWEQVTGVCKQAIKEQVVLPSLFSGSKNIKCVEQAIVRGSERRKTKKKRGYRSAVVNGRATSAFDASAGGEKEVTCELCGLSYVLTSQYQNKQAHSGCGDRAGIKSFDGGTGSLICGGWTGSYSDSRPLSSGWHHFCDRCREKLCQAGGGQRTSLGGRHRSGSSSAAARVASPAQDTIHHNMKNNAMFLLELSSSGMKSRRSGLPSLAEAETLLPSNQFAAAGPIQYFNMLGLSLDALSFGEDFVPSEPGTSGSQTAEADPESVAALNGNEAVEDTFASERSDEAGLGPTVTVRGGGRVFHRSVSVGLTHLDWAEKDLAEAAIQEARALVIPRKRNNSSGSEGMSSILCQPSAALTKLVSVEPEACATDLMVQRPVMQFVLQRHDLESMRFAIQQSLRKATCRIYAMQAFNWLLRNVTQPTCLHDLLWCLVAAMSLPPHEKPDEHSQGKEDVGHKKEATEQDKEAPCEHPLSDMSLAGEACLGPLRSAFHTLLQTISDLMVFLPVGASLQQMAMQCWRLRFMPSDHAFLHRSHVFSNISRILSHSEEEAAAPSELCAVVGTSASAPSDTEHGSCHQPESLTRIEVLRDLTQSVKLTASSRPGMANSLCDNSTETFWESGDEDRNKTKVLTVSCEPDTRPTIVCVYVDNHRDSSNKVNSITFKFGPTQEDMQKLKQMDVEGQFVGWLSCVLPETICIGPNGSAWRLELRGPENTLRLRQVKVLGHSPRLGIDVHGECRSLCIQQRNCEAETLRVFRLLTSQVFGKLLGGDAESPEEDVSARPVGGEATSPERPETSNDLKEHMVGILFSRSKLTHLQKQVCSHIVAALRKEARRVREEWEALLCSPQPSPPQRTAAAGGSGASSHVPAIGGGGGDTYCFEMLSMVLALSGSAVGRAHLSQQAGLLRDIFSLLHTGSARVQRQVTSLLRRVLPEVPPLTLATVLGVHNLPPSEYGLPPSSSASPDADTVEGTAPLDIHRVGLLDVLLACVAKALTLQARSKGGRSQATTLATAIHPRDYLGARWWLRGTTARKLAQGIVQLLRDMAAGKLTDAWARVTKGAIAENILNLTKLAEKYRAPLECLKTPTLWLALASLCVLDQEHVEKLSSGQWAKGRGDGLQAPPRPTCDNHDDGETPAIILCNVCGNVCADCDRFLHLHRRTKTHQRQVFKEEEEAIKVDLHEGCGRTKLFWVMALADSKTLKAMVEFRENSREKSTSVPTAGICRFCGAPGATGLLSAGATCADCREHATNACSKTHPCGHLCNGIRGETACLPCLHGCGASKGLRQDADDMCMICFSEALSCAPAVQLSCGHVFHYHCCKTVLSRGWSGPRITFGFSLCPICKAPMEHAVLKDLLEPIRALFEDVKRKALMRLEYEGLHRAEAITIPGARFYDNPAGFAMERYAYYVCFKCKKAYYGGEVRCDIEAGPVDEYNPAELVCGGCSDISRAQMCPKHGTDFLEYKCRYCCSVAVFFCFGTTHFCNACHDDFQRVANLPKQELPRCPAGPKAKQLEGEECPLHIKHPPTGEEFALGCGVCRNTHTF
ncbi:E3 ubiquitin-protein ligase MYCBP2 [Dermacentor andersoni]|uniref:E3 ubiquitin-protein ligase MYCBP2 n=1 Tax=Dermacentor andersoni TaxID=34620 RepID=UPI002155C45C|nr:E3 ubiquitin-protein ligase MYCBP2-like [Dermacentor andersoni]